MPDESNRRLADLVDAPREAPDVEIKQWLDLTGKPHKAALAKEIAALANHGGGYVVVGFKERDDGTFVPDDNRPPDLKSWSQDAVQGIIEKYLVPSFHCTVTHQKAKKSGFVFVVISIPGGQRVPIVPKRNSPDNKTLVQNRVLIRRPGPNSEEPRSPQEWNEFIDRLVKARQSDQIDIFRSLLEGVIPTQSVASEPTRTNDFQEFITAAQARWDHLVSKHPPDAPVAMPFGHYDMAFAIDGEFDQPSLKDLNTGIIQSVKNHSGWPPFLTVMRDPFTPRPVDGTIEVWHGPVDDGAFDDAAHSDFWRVSPDGFLFTRRGYFEDTPRSAVDPGKWFNITTPTWRLGEGILNANYIAKSLGAEGADLICQATWTGLNKRKLASLDGARIVNSDRYRSNQDEISVSGRASITSIETVLPELVHEMLVPLFEIFGFFDLPKKLVQEELAKLRSNTFPE